MDTGYYIDHGIIWGPKHSGEYWINGNRIICGSKNPGKYRLDENDHIHGPNTKGEFYFQNNRIYGPNANLPWMR